MSEPAVVFDRVWKKFRRGERHNSLRDLIPSVARRAFRRPVVDELDDAQEFWAVKDVSFEVGPGEALGIIGPNGAGKSTTLKLLTRIMKPTRGRCAVRGRVGALIELAAGFHPDLTGRENVYLQGAIMGMKRAEIARKFDEIVAFSELPDFIDTPVKRYSSGMNARLGFSVAAHLSPDVLLIDEVLAVGDFTFQQKCYQRLDEFRRAGLAIVFVSHNMQAISSLCDRALLLRPNREPVLGSIADVTAAYASGAAAVASSRAKVRSAALSCGGEAGKVTNVVVPGTPLTLDVEVAAREDLPRCGFGFVVRRSDGLVAFDSISSLEGAPAVDVRQEAALHCRVHFRANLLRGTYFVSGYLIDSRRVWKMIELGVLGAFVVSETTRLGGCAELAPTYALAIVDETMPASAAS